MRTSPETANEQLAPELNDSGDASLLAIDAIPSRPSMWNDFGNCSDPIAAFLLGVLTPQCLFFAYGFYPFIALPALAAIGVSRLIAGRLPSGAHFAFGCACGGATQWWYTGSITLEALAVAGFTSGAGLFLAEVVRYKARQWLARLRQPRRLQISMARLLMMTTLLATWLAALQLVPMPLVYRLIACPLPVVIYLAQALAPDEPLSIAGIATMAYTCVTTLSLSLIQQDARLIGLAFGATWFSAVPGTLIGVVAIWAKSLATRLEQLGRSTAAK